MHADFQAVTAPRRQEILQLLWFGERTAGDIARHMSVTFSAVSQHLARLRKAGLVHVRKEGQSRIYAVNKEALGPMTQLLETMWSERLEVLRQLSEDEERNRS